MIREIRWYRAYPGVLCDKDAFLVQEEKEMINFKEDEKLHVLIIKLGACILIKLRNIMIYDQDSFLSIASVSRMKEIILAGSIIL